MVPLDDEWITLKHLLRMLKNPNVRIDYLLSCNHLLKRELEKLNSKVKEMERLAKASVAEHEEKAAEATRLQAEAEAEKQKQKQEKAQLLVIWKLSN